MDKLLKILSGSEEPEKKKMLLEAILSQMSSDENKEVNIDEYIKQLIETNNSFSSKKDEFKVGDLVVWKKGLKHKKVPAYNRPAVVVKILENPIIDEQAPIASPDRKSVV